MLRLPSLPRTFEAAKRDLEASSTEVRRSAVTDLARHREAHPEAVEEGLVKALGDAEARVRAAAAHALADGFGTAGAAALADALDDTAEIVVEAALLALGESEEQSVVPRIARLLGDRRARVRYQALIAHARLATIEEAIRAILHATSDQDEFVCHIALRLAEEVADREDGGQGVIDARIVARAAAMLEHDAPRVRSVAAVVAASAGEARADKVLVAIVAGKLAPVESEDIAAAIDLVGERGLRDAIPALERRAFTGFFGIGADEFAWHARVALAKMKHPRAIAEVLKDLRSASYDKRTLAVAAAGRAEIEEAREIIRGMQGQERRAHPSAVEGALESLDKASGKDTRTSKDEGKDES